MTTMPKRDYGLNDSTLSQFALNAVAFLTRDLTDLAKFGITSAKIAEISALQEQFEVFPTDGVKVAQIKQIVIDKDIKRAEVAAAANDIYARAQQSFKDKPGLLDEFQFEGISEEIDTAFTSRAKMIVAAAAKFQTELSDFAQTTAETAAFNALIDELQTMLTAVATAKGDRKETTRARINLGNALYAKVVENCTLARACYANNNAAKYQDYIIYADAGTPKTPPVSTGIEYIDGYVEMLFDVDVTSAEMFKRNDPSLPWEKILNGENAPVFIGTVSGTAYFQGRGRNDAGWGPMASKTIIGTMGSPSNVRFEGDRTLWDNAAGTEYSELQASYDNSVTFQEVGVIVGAGAGVYIWTPPSGTVMLRVRNCAGEVKGPWVVITVVIP